MMSFQTNLQFLTILCLFGAMMEVTAENPKYSIQDVAPQVTTPRDPNTICADAGKTGNFPTDDVACNQFIVCYKLDANSPHIQGVLIMCPAQWYFDTTYGSCTKIMPKNCATKEEPTTTVRTSPIWSTTTVSTNPRDANSVCEDAGVVGNFPTEDDTTCTKFILCYKPTKDVDIFKAMVFNCPVQPVQQYFDPVLAGCTTIRPAKCT